MYLTTLSPAFNVGIPTREKPILTVLGCWFAMAFVYAFAIAVGRKLKDSRSAIGLIVGVALALRVVTLPSTPILEIDLYRYLWDGNASETGVSPFAYTPQDVRLAREFGTADSDLRRLADKARGSDSVSTILDTVHFSYLTTPYPPASQAVFWLTALATPDQASVWTHVFAMKSAVVLFDLATLAFVIILLRRAGLSVGWAVVYGWSPLVLKEFANSGHLDAIAVFFTVSAVATATSPSRIIRSWIRPLIAATLLAVATGSKIYPIALGPVLFAFVTRHYGLRTAVACVLTFAISTAALFAPMFNMASDSSAVMASEQAVASESLPHPPTHLEPDTAPSNSGLTAFARAWEINDLLFAIVIENLKPSNTLGEQPEPWFSVVPQTWRPILLEPTRSIVDQGNDQAFFVARGIAVMVFVTAVVIVTARVFATPIGVDDNSPQQEVRSLGKAVFLTLAWMWLLAPTQNPWYWTWALPFVAFAKQRAWLLLGVLPLTYYVRFWCEAHQPQVTIDTTSYVGVAVFDFLIVWLEFAPFWIALAAEFGFSRISKSWQVRRPNTAAEAR